MAWERYHHTKSYGEVVAMKKSCNKGDVCKYFTAEFLRIVPTFQDPSTAEANNSGSTPGTYIDSSNFGTMGKIKGAVWLNKPNSGTPPDYTSDNELNLNGLTQTITGIGTSKSSGQEIKFTFSETSKGASSNVLWIGYITISHGWVCYITAPKSEEFVYYPGSATQKGIGIAFDAEAIGPGINKPTILITNWSPIVNVAKDAFITWNEVKNQASTVKATVGGKDAGTWAPTNEDPNRGDKSNTSTKKPNSIPVSDGASFVYKASRTNSLYSSLSADEKKAAEDQVTLYTYTHPTLANLAITAPLFTKQHDAINANHSLSLSWQSNNPKNHNISTRPTHNGAPAKATADQHKTQLKMKNAVTTDVNTNATNISQTSVTIPWQNIMKYVPFDSTKPTGEKVTLTLTKTHAQDGDITKAEITKDVIVRYIPTELPAWPAAPQTGFNLNSATGTILQTNSVVDKDPNNSIWVSFTYPAGEYGIIDGYRVRVRSQDGTWFGPYYYNTDRSSPKLNPSVRIPTQDIKFGMQNEVYVEAFYKDNIDGQRYYGPTLKKGFPSVITKLTTPTIIYPTNASEWINKNYRVLFSLPHDGDWGDYTDSIKKGYTYRDIQIKINDSVTYSYKNNPEIFSITPLKPHEAKIVINPSLMSTYPNATSYTFQVRVRKNYGYLDSQEEASWSLWSAARVVTVKPASFSVNKGDYIMASHYNLLKPLMVRMRNTYPTYDVTTTTVQVGDYIEADGYISPYRDILQCFNTVNGWGTYNSARNSVKFNKGVNIPKFEPVVGEYVTAARQDKIYNLSPGAYDGRNYIGIMFDDANLCK